MVVWCRPKEYKYRVQLDGLIYFLVEISIFSEFHEFAKGFTLQVSGSHNFERNLLAFNTNWFRTDGWIKEIFSPTDERINGSFFVGFERISGLSIQVGGRTFVV